MKVKDLKTGEHIFYKPDAEIYSYTFNRALNSYNIESVGLVTDMGDGRFIDELGGVYHLLCIYTDNSDSYDPGYEPVGFVSASDWQPKDEKFYTDAIHKIFKGYKAILYDDYKYDSFNCLGLDESEMNFIRAFIEKFRKNIADNADISEKVTQLMTLMREA